MAPLSVLVVEDHPHVAKSIACGKVVSREMLGQHVWDALSRGTPARES